VSNKCQSARCFLIERRDVYFSWIIIGENGEGVFVNEVASKAQQEPPPPGTCTIKLFTAVIVSIL
jgi:hypothetical protein